MFKSLGALSFIFTLIGCSTPTTVYRQSYDTTYTIHIVKGIILSGEIKNDVTLTEDNYYIVQNYLFIPKGVTVNVEEGTKIQFWASDQYSVYGDNDKAYISVQGRMNFNGTERKPIELFTGKNFELYNNCLPLM